jgi:SsrA-binding protein
VARAKQQLAKRAEKAANQSGDKVVATNRRARHDYDILETYECGLVLQGSEVKSLREGHAVLTDSFARVEGGELWLIGIHIPPWRFSHGFGSHDPDRRRKLLAHRSEIRDMKIELDRQPVTLIPLKLYFKEGRAKVELGLAKGRKTHDKRHAIAERDAKRDMDRARKSTSRFL